MFRWARRVVVVAVIGAVVSRIVGRLLDPDDRPGQPGSEVVPAVGGDTWPPVPTNPDRPG
jgi:hypothetical protein